MIILTIHILQFIRTEFKTLTVISSFPTLMGPQPTVWLFIDIFS